MYFPGDNFAKSSLKIEDVNMNWSRMDEFKECLIPYVESKEIELYIRFNENSNIYQITLTNGINENILNFEMQPRYNFYIHLFLLLSFKTKMEHILDKRIEVDDMFTLINDFSRK